jgi:hypothetical protein
MPAGCEHRSLLLPRRVHVAEHGIASIMTALESPYGTSRNHEAKVDWGRSGRCPRKKSRGIPADDPRPYMSENTKNVTVQQRGSGSIWSRRTGHSVQICCDPRSGDVDGLDEITHRT